MLPVLRITMGLIFLWPFLDKLFALGFSTGRDRETGAVELFGSDAWLNGGSPTTGFLSHGVEGPFAPLLSSLAGNVLVDWLYMLGMGGVGVALIFGIAVRIATAAGIALMVLLRLAVWTSEHNPVLDDHVVYCLVLLALAVTPGARVWSLNSWWSGLPIVRKVPLLR